MKSEDRSSKKSEKKEEHKIQKERILSNILLVSVLALLIYILFLTGIIKFKPNGVVNSPKPSDDVIDEAEVKQDLDPTDSVVTTLYKSVELGRSYNALRHYYFYSYDKLFVKYMDEAFIKEMALSRLTLADSTSFDASILENQYKNIVGNNTIYKNRTFQTQCATVRYNATLNNYTISKNVSCITTNDNNDGYFDKIIGAYKYSDRIEIITRVGYYEGEKELVSDGVYQSTNKIIIRKNMDADDVIGTYTESLDQIKKIIDYSRLTKFKYTFRLDNNKYYFYSVEVDE